MTAFTPSPEQIANRERFRSLDDLLIQAGAGCGKTHQIVDLWEIMATERTAARGLYITLQKTLAAEVQAKLKPYEHSVAFSGTVHSLAWNMLRFMRPDYMSMVNRRMGGRGGPRLKAYELPELIGLTEGVLFHRSGTTTIRRAKAFYGKPRLPKDKPMAETEVWLTPYQLYQVATDTVKRYCMSDDDELNDLHAFAALARKKTWAVPYKVRPKIVEIITEVAQSIWADALSPEGGLPYQHDWYLKFWSLCRPDILRDGQLAPGSVLFFDEAQDSKPCVSAVIEHQRSLPEPRVQIVTVGDSAQAIYGFTGAKDALRRFSAWEGVQHGSLSTSWRFHQGIADEANNLLELLRAPIRLQGNPAMSVPNHGVNMYSDGIETIATEVDAVICRTNRDVIAAVTPLITAGRTVFCDVDTKEMLSYAEDLQAIKERRTPKSADMKVFTSPEALADYLSTADDNDDMASALKQIEKLGEDRVIEALSKVTLSRAQADVVVSTIHKAKGQQWHRVALVMDPATVAENLFLDQGDTLRDETLMVLYVAVTRAQERVFIPSEVRAAYLAEQDRQIEEELQGLCTVMKAAHAA